ncbi:MAG: hypothetical protein KGH64_01745 [Candidatus Micrarchaeota archaeon]|nr:hypothetical protein [Candidatus Micrarchaeota archaeon]MDE1859130.1 hypothetical protein [Candidatus Micrarchaeota archaeon]
MCRMFSYAGNSHTDIAELHKALKSAARNDAYMARNGRAGQCADGWGYVMATQGRIFRYTTDIPIYDDRHTIPRISSKAYAIFHARKASDRRKLGVGFSHPFEDSGRDGLIFLAHNGLVRMDDQNDLTRSDTEYAMQIISEKGIEKGLEVLRGLTLTGLNLAILQVEKPENSHALMYLNFYKNNHINYLKRYFELYYKRTDSGISVMSSSLLGYGIKPDGIVPYGVLGNIERLG